MKVSLLLLGLYTLTAYRPVVEQTDSSPCIPANGQYVHTDGVAISRDLHVRYGGSLKFGDLIFIEDVGWKIVIDLMNKRHKRSVDVLVKDLHQEKLFYKRCKFCQKRVYKLEVRPYGKDRKND